MQFVNLRDAAGRTALHYAVAAGDLQTQHLLITAGAWLTPAAACDCLDAAPVNKGATPLHLAAIRGDKPSAVLLLTAYVTAAAGALPEVEQFCCTCDGSDSEDDGLQCDWCSEGGRSRGRSSSCRRERLQDPRTVEDWYGLTPFALADSKVQGGSLKQLLNPSANLTELLQALPGSRRGTREAEAAVAATGAGFAYRQLVRSLSNAG
ncbi:hypothetical protein OEZ86_011251 [Tetradesmus obliquus]|nr:hypothetical protein OEZ86_011251 [Tetradesmus obliquus]